MSDLILVADVGGTSTRFGCASRINGQIVIHKTPNDAHADLAAAAGNAGRYIDPANSAAYRSSSHSLQITSKARLDDKRYVCETQPTPCQTDLASLLMLRSL